MLDPTGPHHHGGYIADLSAHLPLTGSFNKAYTSAAEWKGKECKIQSQLGQGSSHLIGGANYTVRLSFGTSVMIENQTQHNVSSAQLIGTASNRARQVSIPTAFVDLICPVEELACKSFVFICSWNFPASTAPLQLKSLWTPITECAHSLCIFCRTVLSDCSFSRVFAMQVEIPAPVQLKSLCTTSFVSLPFNVFVFSSSALFTSAGGDPSASAAEVAVDAHLCQPDGNTAGGHCWQLCDSLGAAPSSSKSKSERLELQLA